MRENIFARKEQEVSPEELPTHVLQNAYNEVTERIRDKELEMHELQVLQMKLYHEIQSRLQGADAPMDEVAQ